VTLPLYLRVNPHHSSAAPGQESAPYQLRVQPALQALLVDEARALAENRADSGRAEDRLGRAGREWRAPTLWGQKIVKLWSFVLCVALYIQHQVGASAHCIVPWCCCTAAASAAFFCDGPPGGRQRRRARGRLGAASGPTPARHTHHRSTCSEDPSPAALHLCLSPFACLPRPHIGIFNPWLVQEILHSGHTLLKLTVQLFGAKDIEAVACYNFSCRESGTCVVHSSSTGCKHKQLRLAVSAMPLAYAS
jgi:hypothetical protein